MVTHLIQVYLIELIILRMCNNGLFPSPAESTLPARPCQTQQTNCYQPLERWSAPSQTSRPPAPAPVQCLHYLSCMCGAELRSNCGWRPGVPHQITSYSSYSRSRAGPATAPGRPAAKPSDRKTRVMCSSLVLIPPSECCGSGSARPQILFLPRSPAAGDGVVTV